MIDPTKIIIRNDGGDGDMGSLAYAPDNTAHFHADGEAFAVVFIRLHFAGGSGTADVTINIDSNRQTQYDTLLYTLKARGVGADANFRILEEELVHWVFQAGDEMVFQWTNPSSGTMAWGAEVGLIRVSDIATG